MPEHENEIEKLMKSAMESIRDMLDVNTVIGDMIQAPDGTAIIPISKIHCGFIAGGGEYGGKKENNPGTQVDWPFAGGSGGGFCVQPVGFLVINKQQIRLLPVEDSIPLERLVDAAPAFISQVQEFFSKSKKPLYGTNDSQNSISSPFSS